MMKKWTIVLLNEQLGFQVVHVQAEDPGRAMLKAPRGVILAVFVGWHIDKKGVTS